MNGFGKVAIRHIFEVFGCHNFLMHNGLVVYEIGKAKDERKNKT